MADDQSNSQRPPLPKPLMVVLWAGTAVFLAPLLLLLPFPEPWPLRIMGAWAIIGVAVVLAAAFVMLREYFSAPRNHKRPPTP